MPTLQIDANTHTRDHWTAAEVDNVRLVADFVQLVMNDHDFVTARQRFGTSPYLQHNRGLGDGMEALITYVERLVRRYPDYTYDVKRITADGDRVIFHSHATLKTDHRGDDGRGLNIVDIWRVADGRIEEHWDAIQPLAPSMRLLNLVTGGAVRNSNGTF